jgi:hypothetical protein
LNVSLENDKLQSFKSLADGYTIMEHYLNGMAICTIRDKNEERR